MVDSLVLCVAPSRSASHYAEFLDDILGFQSRLIDAAHDGDRFLMVVDPATQQEAAGSVPQQNMLPGSIPDIWIRDFAPVRTAAGIFSFHYLPSYLRNADAQYIERGFMRWLRSVGLETEMVDLILDGGNFVYNGRDTAVVTERVLEDNPSHSREEIQREIQARLELETLAIIPEGVREKTGHADGMVVWLAEDVLGVAHYQEPVRSKVLRVTEQSLPGVELVELPFQPTGEMWQGWESAGGVYVNALRTANALYVPQFGLKADEEALDIYWAHSSQTVIPVQTGPEVRLGGSVHCLTWALEGEDARKVMESQGRVLENQG